MPILQVNNLKKGFGKTDVLKGVSFSLEQGQVLAIIGSSGSGKTTLLRCLNFLETPDAGEILVNGKELLCHSEEEVRQNRLHFGLVFQNFNLFPQYTVLDKGAGTPASRSGGTVREGGLLSLAALRRPAAAGGHSPGAGAESGGALFR